MSCPSPDRVLDYLARRVGSQERDAIEMHVDTCSACRQLLGELARSTLVDELVAPDPEHEPTQIDRYRIESRLGGGGMGTVYAAYDPQLERRVAVKLVHPELAVRGGVERLLREGRALARLAHPNVVAVHDAGVADGRVYVAMELVEGETLAAWLETPRGWREIVRKFVDAARGLAAAHRAGIVHRDVKPENILLDARGRAKVADFGLAGQPEDIAGDAGVVMGTPMFMSPEQRRGDEVGPATDQFALATACWNALFDREPKRRVPGWLKRALARGRATEPAGRHRSVDDLRAAIDPELHARRARRATLATGAAALGAGALVLYAAWPAAAAPDREIAAACESATAANTTLWSPVEREAVHAAFRATSVPYAEQTWTRVDAAIASDRTELDAAVTRLCEHWPRTAEARDAFHAGLSCLADRRDNTARLVTRFKTIAVDEVRRAVDLAHRIPTIEDCANPVVLAAERAATAMPGGPAARAATKAAVTAGRAAHDAGQFQTAVGHARQAVEHARPLGGMFLAGALVILGDFVTGIDLAEAEAAYRQAISAAELVHADDLRALALARLMHAIAVTPGREREGLALEPNVSAAIARSGKRAAIAPALHQTIGIAKFQLGQIEPALVELQAALTSARAVIPDTDPRIPQYLYPIGIALGVLGRDQEALAIHQEAVRVATEVWGSNHPETARFTIHLATKQATLGECTAAIPVLVAARKALTGSLPPDSFEHLQITQTLSTCYANQQRHDDALRELRAGQEALRAAKREQSVEMASAWVDLGDVDYDRKQFTEALAAYRSAVALYEKLVPRDDSRLALPLSRVGEALDALGKPAQAIAPLERSLAIYTTSGSPARLVAEAAFPLARALWATRRDRTRARKLAESALAGLAGDEREAEVESWLRTHGPR
jgi:tetratricopeptide (TPR) repeat protein/tRNA A-37 threonylcarbamoyl transferase component Bud32